MEFLTDTLTMLLRLAHAVCSRSGRLLCVLGFIFWSGNGFTGMPVEYAVKAAYLTKFGIYAEWPSTAFATADSAVNLCLVGVDPFGAILDKAVVNQRVGNRPIILRRLKTVTRESGCHILYIGSADLAYITQTVEALRGSSVLTVTDAEPGVAPGIINFVIQDNRVRFEVDEAAAIQNELALSSKLFSLALNVKAKR